VENDNGLVRQYFPKGSDFTGITLERLQEVEDEINNRPRREANNHKQRSDSKNPHLDIP
jgi:IS30 family transposase